MTRKTRAKAVLAADLYATAGNGEHAVAEDVRAWCLTAPDSLRIVLAGYDAEHNALLAHGWRSVAGKAGRGSGYSVDPLAGRRERLWLSPACLGHEQTDLFDMEGEES